MITIKEYDEKYIEQISNIITRNLLEINSKDYGIESVMKMAKDFKIDKLKITLKKRTKVFIALKDDEVVGTASIDLSYYNPDEYWILSVFVKPENHCEGIGTLLIKTIEKYAINSNFKKLIIPASITASEFYHKLGYAYKDNKKVLNSENLYLMEKTFELTYREIKKEEVQDALDLVHCVFDEFEAPFYPQNGIQSFYNFIKIDNILPQYLNNSLYFYGCFVEDTIVGIIAMRDFTHISLLFVNKYYHKQGIARHLLKDTLSYCKIQNPYLNAITVNSSPYAVEVYHKFGFVDTSTIQTIDGITFTPMKMML